MEPPTTAPTDAAASGTAVRACLPSTPASGRRSAQALVVFFLAITAEMNRPPFDLTEAEQELVGGYQTEYSSMRFAMYYLAEFLAVVVMSTIIITLFLGGPRPLFDIPGIGRIAILREPGGAGVGWMTPVTP